MTWTHLETQCHGVSCFFLHLTVTTALT